MNLSNGLKLAFAAIGAVLLSPLLWQVALMFGRQLWDFLEVWSAVSGS